MTLYLIVRGAIRMLLCGGRYSVSTIVGLLRSFAFALLLLAGTLLVLLVTPLPLRIHEARLAAWITSGMARIGLWLMGVEMTVEQPARLRRHRGFIFPNHSSMLDVIALEAFFPMRYLAKAEIRNYPVFGALAVANETVFVQRDNRASRAAARLALGKIGDYPPIVVFPEGTTGPGTSLLPFRHGAFATAERNGLPVLLCAIIYNRPDVTTWHEQPLAATFWTIITRHGPLTVTLRPLPPFTPSSGATSAEQADTAHSMMNAALADTGMLELPGA